MITDEDNVNNRFDVAAVLNARCDGDVPGPLWGCPPPNERASLKATSPGHPYSVEENLSLPRLRLTDAKQRGVQPVWRLYGNSSVGSQVLVGIPVVRSFRDDPQLSELSRVWPFETGFTATPTPHKGPFVLHAEIWPGITTALDPNLAIRDQAQVKAIARLFARLDHEGSFGELFARPRDLAADDEATVIAEEGGILGTGLSFRN